MERRAIIVARAILPPMGPEAWLVAGLILIMLSLLGSGRFAADVVVLCVVLVLLICGIITPAEALRGFANPGVVTVAFLYIVATGLKETGAMAMLTERLLGRPRTALAAQARLVLPVAGLSAFINNTPIVAMFMPVLTGLSRRTGIAPSRLFLPLSYAAILGGVCTLIGTSTNVVVAGLIQTHNREFPEASARLPEMGMFTISALGVPVAIAGVLYLLLAGRRLLPDRRSDPLQLESARQYATAMRIAADCPIVGRTVEKAGLRHLPGLFLSRIERAESTLVAVAPDEVLRAGDTLVFVGVLESVVDLQKIRGLVPVAEEHAEPASVSNDAASAAPEPIRRGNGHALRARMKLVEVVISPASPLVGLSVREGGFRTRYRAVIIGVHRHGQRVPGKIGDIVLRPGDTLLIEAPPEFTRQFKDSADFYLVSELDGAAAPRHDRTWVALGIFALLVILFTIGSLNLGPGWDKVPSEMVIAMAGAVLMVIFRCCTTSQARASLDWTVLIVIAASFGVGRAMESTGLANVVADSITAAAASGGTTLLLAGIYLITLIFTALINNNAAAVLMFPIVVQISRDQGLPFTPLILCMVVAASCEFATPIGYQTNLMVMGPGGYRWSDYLRFGGPLTLICGVVAVAAASVIWF